MKLYTIFDPTVFRAGFTCFYNVRSRRAKNANNTKEKKMRILEQDVYVYSSNFSLLLYYKYIALYGAICIYTKCLRIYHINFFFFHELHRKNYCLIYGNDNDLDARFIKKHKNRACCIRWVTGYYYKCNGEYLQNWLSWADFVLACYNYMRNTKIWILRSLRSKLLLVMFSFVANKKRG